MIDASPIRPGPRRDAPDRHGGPRQALRRGPGARRRDRHHRRARDRPARRQRRRQVDADEGAAGAGAPDAGRVEVLGHRRGPPPRRDPPPAGLHARARLPAARHDRPRPRGPHGRAARAAAARRRAAGLGGAVPGGPGGGALAPDPHLLDRHEAARQARPGDRPLAGAGGAGRAHQRPRPLGARGDALAGAAPVERARHRGAAVVARAGGRHQHLRRRGGAARRAGRDGGAHRRADAASPARASWCAGPATWRLRRRSWPRAGCTPSRRDGGMRRDAAPTRTRCWTACATRPPTRAWGCASCARPGGPWRTPWWTRSSEHALRRRRDPRCAVRSATRASGAAAWPACVSLARWGALRSLGARRGWKAKAVPITLTLLAVAPADHRAGRPRAVRGPERHRPDRRAAVRGLPGDHRRGDPAVRRDHHARSCSARTAATAPSQLYFSTAVSRREYLAGRRGRRRSSRCCW